MKILNSKIHATKIILHDNELQGSNFNVNPDFFKEVRKINDTNYKLLLSVEIKNTEKNPFPVNLELVFETTFTFEDCDKTKEIEVFLNINAVQMIFPFMRSSINSVISAAMMPPLVLPIIDVRRFKEKKFN